MDKKLLLAAAAALAIGFLAGNSLGSKASKAALNQARADGCTTLGKGLTGGLVGCVIRDGVLVGQVNGVDAYDLDNEKPIN